MAEFVLLILFVILISVVFAKSIQRVNDYYVNHFSFSIWAGTLLLIPAFICLMIASYAYTKAISSLLQIIGLSLVAFVCIQDVRLSTLPFGIIAFLIQTILFFSLFAFVLFAIARFIINRLLGKKSIMSRLEPGFIWQFSPSEPIRYYFSLHIK